MVEIVRGAITSNLAAKNVLDNYFDQKLASHGLTLKGILYIGYPIIGEGDSIDALLVSEECGLIIFDLVDGTCTASHSEKRDTLYNTLYSNLIRERRLVKSRDLLVDLHVVTFSPGTVVSPESESEEFAKTEEELTSYIKSVQNPRNQSLYEIVLSTIQVATKIRTAPIRNIVNKLSKGAALKQIEEAIATLDIEQNKAVIETTDGIQRIRGLAGSGKTIILALKAAYIYACYPNQKIAITFFTRSLKPMFISFINRFVWEYTRSEPDFNRLHILSSWGSPRDPGVYSEVCRVHSIRSLDFQLAKQKTTPSDDNAFSVACNDALSQIIANTIPIYDIILLDEAQDLPSSFLILCQKILTENGKLVIAYDELQNLHQGSPVNIKSVFKDDDFTNKKGMSKKDIILPTCYRNPKEIIVTAHAIGFGLYRKNGIVQIFDNLDLWKEVGYVAKEGKLGLGNHVVLERASGASPRYYEEVMKDRKDFVSYQAFENREAEAKWVAAQINKNLTEDDLGFKDILVIAMQQFGVEAYVGSLRIELHKSHGIQSHIAGVTTRADSFFSDNSITISGIFRAKGNEAAVVYLVGADICMTLDRTRQKRNQLFTGITRSKAWVVVTGCGENLIELGREIDMVKAKNYCFDFTYPTKEQLENIDKIFSDYIDESKKAKIENTKKLFEQINQGQLDLEYLTQEEINILKRKMERPE